MHAIGFSKSSDRSETADVSAYLVSLPEGRRSLFSRNSGIEIPDSAGEMEDVLVALPGSVSDLLAVTGVRVSSGGNVEFALELGRAAVEVSGTTEEEQLARVCLAQTHFRGRKDPQQLDAFEQECRKAIDLGHAGTFCYERLAVLYEHRGDVDATVALCLKAVETLGAAGDERSADSFRKRLARVRGKQGRRQGS